MSPDLLWGLSFQVEVPDTVCEAIKSAFLWVCGSPDADRTALSAIFALNAGFASIDYFMQGIMRSLRKPLNRRIAKYNKVVDQWSKPVGEQGTGANLQARESVNGLAERVLDIQSSLPETFGRTAVCWKLLMAACAAVTLVLMVIPCCWRITVVLALPVPLFAFFCYRKKEAIKDELKSIDKEFDRLSVEARQSTPLAGQELQDRMEEMEKNLAQIVSALRLPQPITQNRRKGKRSKPVAAK